MLEIFITIVTPIISITEMLHIIANNNLNVPPICPSNFTILVSAIGWHSAEPK